MRHSSFLLARMIDNNEADSKERIAALKLQARAWRQVAMIALVDRDRAVGNAKWLMMVSVPYVDGEAVTKFVEDSDDYATACAREAGVVV